VSHSNIDQPGSQLTLDELSPDARALVQAGRAALTPTAADSARVLAALSGRVSITPASELPAAAAAKSGLGWQAISAVVVGLVGVGGIAYLGVRDEPKTVPVVTHAPPAAVVAAETGTAPAPSPALAAPVVTGQSAPSATSDAQPATARRSDRLAAEVSILSRAETELHAGRFKSALKLLDEHARLFPRGTLTPERIGARVQALCGLGRVSEANADLARLAPGSLQASGARDACTKR
jgi:RNA polymerase sigma-70 factor (ECF subfamily)